MMMAPAGVPAAIIEKLNRDLRTVVAQPELLERYYQIGTYTRDLSPAEAEAFIRNEEKLWWPIVERVEAGNR
jgi:tripartite-type tricarboxylate transporter receptor subunit TctC